MVIPADSSSSRLATGYRRPRTVGWPWHTAGSAVMRSSLDIPCTLGLKLHAGVSQTAILSGSTVDPDPRNPAAGPNHPQSNVKLTSCYPIRSPE